MKKLCFIIVILLCVSCKKNEEPEVVNKTLLEIDLSDVNEIIGKWETTHEPSSGWIEEEYYGEWAWIPQEDCETWEINADGTMIRHCFPFVRSGTYTYDNGTLLYMTNPETTADTFSYVFSKHSEYRLRVDWRFEFGGDNSYHSYLIRKIE